MAAAMRDAQQRLAAMQARRGAAEALAQGAESPAGGAAAADAGAHFSPRSDVGADARALIVQVGK
jgi:hypothetical protein